MGKGKKEEMMGNKKVRADNRDDRPEIDRDRLIGELVKIVDYNNRKVEELTIRVANIEGEMMQQAVERRQNYGYGVETRHLGRDGNQTEHLTKQTPAKMTPQKMTPRENESSKNESSENGSSFTIRVPRGVGRITVEGWQLFSYIDLPRSEEIVMKFVKVGAKFWESLVEE
jgi:hypothetical protein